MTDAAGRSADPALLRTVRIVALLNLGYFGIEFAVALAIGSVALFADSIDFLEDTAVNLLILVAVGWPRRKRARAGMVMAGLILVPAVATLWQAAQKFVSEAAPAPVPLSLAGLGALAVNFTCAWLLLRYRHHGGSMTKAAFLSARNDVAANLAIIAAGLLTAAWLSHWPDLVVGLGIAALNWTAAKEVWEAAVEEHRAGPPPA